MITALNTITNRFRLLEGTQEDIAAAYGLKGDVVFVTDPSEGSPPIYFCHADGAAYTAAGAGAPGGATAGVLEVHAAPAVPADPTVPFIVVRYLDAGHTIFHSQGSWSPTAEAYVPAIGDLMAV